MKRPEVARWNILTNLFNQGIWVDLEQMREDSRESAKDFFLIF